MNVNAACQQAAGVVGRETPRDRLRLAFLRALAGAVRPFVPGPRPLGTTPRILVLRPDHLGDLLFATPAFQALRESFPPAHITALVGPWGRDIVARNPHVDAVRTCSFPWFDRRPKRSLLAPYRLLWREAAVLRVGFDVALNLRPDFWWGAVLAYLARIPFRVGYDVPTCRPFLTTRIPHAGVYHDVERNLALVAALTRAPLDVTYTRWPLAYAPTDEERAWAAQTLAGHDAVVAVSPGAGTRCKQWTVEGWAQVIDTLTASYGLHAVLVGGPAEVDRCRAIADRVSSPPLVLAGETTLGQLAALFGQCRLVVGIDSGPLNLAVARGTPTVHLFGPADPAQFGPWGPARRHAVVCADMPCMPCRKLDWPIADAMREVTPCMAAIAPADVVAAAARVLEG
jgi:lipopolysaccharide heptosyltransferase II